jgi:AcrR family transcriptional regulator
MDDRLLDAAVAVLDEHGRAGLTLERVAERAGRSRVTLWRQGVTQDSLLDGLLARLTRDYRDAMWPVLADAGSGADRLRTALEALCDVTDRHLHLLTVDDDVFHLAADRVRDITGQAFSFLDPFVAALRAGAADGSLKVPDGPLPDLADTVFNTVCWGYVHLRHRHGWPDQRARRPVLGITLAGLGVDT